MALLSQHWCTSPVITAVIFVGTALILDVFIVALLIEKSSDVIQSVLGVWFPQALIFMATYLTGRMLLF